MCFIRFKMAFSKGFVKKNRKIIIPGLLAHMQKEIETEIKNFDLIFYEKY